MDAYTIYFIVAVVGGFISTVVPYYLKYRKEKTQFDLSYVWGLLVSAAVAGVALVPEGEVTAKGIIIVFCAAIGITLGSNKVNSTRINRKN